MGADTNRKITRKKLIPSFGVAVVLLLGIFITPSLVAQAQQQMNMGTSTNSDPNAQLAALQKQQAKLIQQEQATSRAIQKQQATVNLAIQQTQSRMEQHHKDTFFTAGLAKPTLSASAYDKIKHCNPNQSMPAINSSAFFNWWKTYLTDFHCGHVTKVFSQNNTAEREFTLIADDNQGFGHYIKITKNITDPVVFPAWTFNNTVPAPTLRVTQGDHVKITIVNSANSKFPHSFHVHSIHSGEMDGMTGAAGSIPPGASFTYEFIARPFGVYPFHCHMEPIEQHIQRGLYGMLIIDPPKPRPPAHEMVMIMNGFSFNQINLVHPNNNPHPLLLPPTAAALRNATQDFGILPTALGAGDDIGQSMVENVMAEQKQQQRQQHNHNNDGNNNDNNNQQHQQPTPVVKSTPPPSAPTFVQISDNDNNGGGASSGGGSTTNKDDNAPSAADAAKDQAADAAKEAAQEQKDAALEPGGGEAGNDNQFYAVNSMAFGYTGKEMIPLKTNTIYRIYLVNMVEFDPMNSFHLHGGMFQYYPSGTSMRPAYMNDIILLGQGDRGIVEFHFVGTGDFMFHAHINRFASLGWLDMFHVTKAGETAPIVPLLSPPSHAPTTPSLAPQIPPRTNNSTAIPFLNVAANITTHWNSTTKPWPHQAAM